MTALGIDLGGTKVSFAVFTAEGMMLQKQTVPLNGQAGSNVAELIIAEATAIIGIHPSTQSLAICVPGIYHYDRGTVWAPNIDGWEDYPLLQQLQQAFDMPVTIDSDRAAYILGESWMGNSKGCKHAIYLAIGTGIGAGILIDGNVLRGAHDIAGAIGWLALKPPFKEQYISCGCFEHHASGEGIAKVAKEILLAMPNYNGVLKQKLPDELSSHDVFAAYEQNDPVAGKVFNTCIEFWGMAVANLVSLFNPEKIILGGGVFGPAVRFMDDIKKEAAKWAQPISMKLVSIEPSALGSDAGLYGAGLMAMNGLAIGN